jgi:hypothetical protein
MRLRTPARDVAAPRRVDAGFPEADALHAAVYVDAAALERRQRASRHRFAFAGARASAAASGLGAEGSALARWMMRWVPCLAARQHTALPDKPFGRSSTAAAGPTRVRHLLLDLLQCIAHVSGAPDDDAGQVPTSRRRRKRWMWSRASSERFWRHVTPSPAALQRDQNVSFR